MQMTKRRAPWWIVPLAAVLTFPGCDEGLDPEPPRDNGQTFGEKFFNIICQRVAYSSSVAAHKRSLAAHQADPRVPVRPKDVSGSEYRLACRYGLKYLPGYAKTRDPKVYALVQGRSSMVQAINLIFPGNELSELQDYLVKILPLTDNGAFPNLVTKGAAIIKKELESDSDFQWSLARLTHRVGYLPRKVCLGIKREILSYPKLHSMLNTLLAFAGEGGAGHQALLDLLQALAFELRTMYRVDDKTRPGPIHQGASDRTLRLALDLLFTQDSRLGTGQAPLLLVRRDWRGVACVLPGSTSKKLPVPFQDKDNDGLADINSLGQFLTLQSAAPPEPFHYDSSLADTAKRDSSGRALDAQGNVIFDYINLDTTLVAALARDAVKIMDVNKDVAMELLLGLNPLLGGRRTATKTTGGESITYKGFDTSRAPLLDLAHALLQVLKDPNIDSALEGVDALLSKHEGVTARLLDALMDVKDRGKKHPEAHVAEGSILWDDMVIVLQKVVRTKGLLEDLIKALGDPRTKSLAVMLANYMKYSDVHVLDKSYKSVVDLDGSKPSLKSMVDRSKPDSGDNRSIQQRLLHIINNTNGMKLCNKKDACIGLKLLGYDLCIAKFKECELFQVDNGAVFYTQSIARLRDGNGKVTSTPKAYMRLKTENMPSWLQTVINTVGVDTIFSMLSGIDGMSSHPTTEALNRLMFMDTLPATLAMLQDPPRDIENNLISSYFRGSLVSWEIPHPGLPCSANAPCKFYDAMRPVIQAFADHNTENLFIDLLSVLHKHWASRRSTTHQFSDPKKPAFAYGSDMVSWEPRNIELLEKTDLLTALNAASPVLTSLKLSDGRSALTELVKTIAFVIDPDISPPFKFRDGRTVATKSDGKTTVTCGTGGTSTACVTPLYLFADALDKVNAAIKSCTIECPRCGDGICGSSENAASCKADCQHTCGNGSCDVTETFSSCSKDCAQGCGDGRCTGSEAYRTCPADCPGICGDGICQSSNETSGQGKVVSESYQTCPADCPSGCGDGTCSSAEKDQKLFADAWDSSISDLADIFLDVDNKGSASKLKNRRLVPVGSVMVSFLRKRLKAHSQAGDLYSWLDKELPESLKTKLGGPVVARAADFLKLVQGADKVRAAIYDLSSYLVDELNYSPAFRASLTGLADMVQLFIDDLNLVPVARVLGRVLHPKEELIKTALRFLKPAIAWDERSAMTKVLRNAYKEQSPGQSPAQTLLDLAAKVHRLYPGASTPYVAQDYAQAFTETRDFLNNGETGLKKFFEIIKQRCGAAGCPASASN